MDREPQVTGPQDPYDENDRCLTCQKDMADCACRLVPIGHYSRLRDLLLVGGAQ